MIGKQQVNKQIFSRSSTTTNPIHSDRRWEKVVDEQREERYEYKYHYDIPFNHIVPSNERFSRL